MQYKVPQNIDIEDKIVGPFTMKQFLYLFVGGFILYGWWNYSNTFVSPPPMTIFLSLGIPLGLLFFCLAVVKVNDRPFESFILSLFRFFLSPRQRKWITGYVPEAVITLDPLEAKNKKDDHIKSESDLDSLAKSLEQQTGEIKAQTAQIAQPVHTSGKPQNINLSVSDLNSASQKQQAAQSNTVNSQQAQTITQPAKKGILSIFK